MAQTPGCSVALKRGTNSSHGDSAFPARCLNRHAHHPDIIGGTAARIGLSRPVQPAVEHDAREIPRSPPPIITGSPGSLWTKAKGEKGNTAANVRITSPKRPENELQHNPNSLSHDPRHGTVRSVLLTNLIPRKLHRADEITPDGARLSGLHRGAALF